MSPQNGSSKDGMENLLRYMNGFDQLGAHHLLLAEHDVFDEINRDIIVGRQVDVAVCGEKVVDFSFAPIFR